MIEELADYDWECAFEYIECNRNDVAEIYASDLGENDEQSWCIYGKLNDDRYFYLSAWCDYTGWDCQAGGEGFIDSDLNVIKSKVAENERPRLGINGEPK